jgi:hypothetical protein
MKISAVSILAIWAPALCAQGVRFQTVELPQAAIGTLYNAPVVALPDGRCVSGGGVVLGVAEGELPHGVELRGDSLTGIPDTIGTSRFTLRAATGCGAAEREFEVMVTGRPILRAIPEELIFEYRAGDAQPGSQSVRVSGTWPGLPYMVRAEHGPWIAWEPREGATPGRGSAFSADEIAVRVDPSKLAPGVYHAVLVLSAWQGANAPKIAVTLKITGSTPPPPDASQY